MINDNQIASPDDVEFFILSIIDEDLIYVLNRLLISNIRGNVALITESEIVKEMNKRKKKEFKKEDIDLRFVFIYGRFGWVVQHEDRFEEEHKFFFYVKS